MISTEIEFRSPTSLEEALAILAERPDDITVMSGGMSLLPMMNLGLAGPEAVLSLRKVAELGEVTDEGDAVVIGAMVTHAQVAAHPLVRESASAVAQAAAVIGDVQVRNRGTIGGSVSHADPSADYLPSLSAHQGSVVLSSSSGTRTVPAADFFLDVMYTARQSHELVTAVRIPKMGAGAVAEYIRLTRVEGSFAIVNGAVVMDHTSGTLAMGGVGPTPFVLDISSYLASDPDAASAAIGDAVYEACDQVQGDIMSDADYRREMARVHARRVVQRAVQRLRSDSTR